MFKTVLRCLTMLVLAACNHHQPQSNTEAGNSLQTDSSDYCKPIVVDGVKFTDFRIQHLTDTTYRLQFALTGDTKVTLFEDSDGDGEFEKIGPDRTLQNPMDPQSTHKMLHGRNVSKYTRLVLVPEAPADPCGKVTDYRDVMLIYGDVK